MKQFVVTVLLAGLLAPASGMAQEGYRCVIVCNPPRVYCVPNGSQLPPIINICKPYQVSSETSLLSAPSDAATAPQSACSAQSVFNEETQTTEWQMVCD